MARHGTTFTQVTGTAERVCPFSGLGAVTLLWALTAAIVERLVGLGITPSIYPSIHTDGGPERVEQAESRYKELGY